MGGTALTTAIDALVPVFAGLLGLSIGSFLNVVIYRVPRGESLVRPASHCPDCGEPIKARHNIPVLGWIMLRGRCASCQRKISARYPIVELGTALLFIAVAARLDDHLPVLPAYLWFAGIGIALAAIDLDTHRLPDVIVLPSYVVLAVLLALGGDWSAYTRAAIGAGILLVIYFLIAFAAPRAMGLGDVKLSGLIGAMTAYISWGTLIVGAFLAFLLGAVIGVLLMVVGRVGRKSAIPFGPFMIAGALIAILGAGGIGDWYLDYLSF